MCRRTDTCWSAGVTQSPSPTRSGRAPSLTSSYVPPHAVTSASTCHAKYSTHPFSAAHRLPVAHAAAQLPCVEDSVSLLPLLVRGWHVEAAEPRGVIVGSESVNAAGGGWDEVSACEGESAGWQWTARGWFCAQRTCLKVRAGRSCCGKQWRRGDCGMWRWYGWMEACSWVWGVGTRAIGVAGGGQGWGRASTELLRRWVVERTFA